MLMLVLMFVLLLALYRYVDVGIDVRVAFGVVTTVALQTSKLSSVM